MREVCIGYRCVGMLCFFFKQKTAYEMRISDWSSDVCSSDLTRAGLFRDGAGGGGPANTRWNRQRSPGRDRGGRVVLGCHPLSCAGPVGYRGGAVSARRHRDSAGYVGGGAFFRRDDQGSLSQGLCTGPHRVIAGKNGRRGGDRKSTRLNSSP